MLARFKVVFVQTVCSDACAPTHWCNVASLWKIVVYLFAVSFSWLLPAVVLFACQLPSSLTLPLAVTCCQLCCSHLVVFSIYIGRPSLIRSPNSFLVVFCDGSRALPRAPSYTYIYIIDLCYWSLFGTSCSCCFWRRAPLHNPPEN